MEEFKLIFWNEFKRIFCYFTGVRCLLELFVKPWKRYSILTSIKINDFKQLIKENNIKVLILDMDGTLKHYKKGLLNCNKKWVNDIKKHVKVYVISNANNKLTSKVANQLNVPYICSAMKPSKKGFEKIMKIEKVSPSEVLVIGDAIIADIIGSRRAKINKNILLDDMNINKNKIEINFD